LTNEQAKYADELIDNNSLLSKGYELSKNAGNIAKASAKTLGVNALDSTVDVLQYAKNAFKSEMNGDKSEDLKLAIKLQNGFRGNQNQLTDEQANEFINYVKNKYNVSDFQNELNNINEWTYKENKLENATNELVSKVNEGNTELGKIGQRVANAFGTVGRMTPTIATNIVAPGLSYLPMYMSSAQASQDEALKNGASYDNAVANGKLKGALEVATEAIGGERIGKLTGIPTLTNKLGIHTGILGEIASEEIEEILSTTVDPLIDRFTYNPNAPMATKEDYWNTFIDTALSTVLLMGVGKGIDTVTEYRDKAISKVNESNMSAEQKQQSISEIEKGANELIDKVKNNAQNSTNINENTPNIEQISQNNVQNVAPNTATQTNVQNNEQSNVQTSQNNVQPMTNEQNTTLPQNASNNVSELPQNTTNTIQGKVTTPTNKKQNLIPNNSNMQNTSNNVQTSQNDVQNVSNLENTIQNDTERFSQQVDAWKNNEWNPKEDLVVLDHTPQLYQELGLRDLPVTLNPSKLNSIYNKNGRGKQNYHGLEELIKQIPEALKEPLNIVESNSRENSIVVITSLSDKEGNIITVPIAIDEQGNLSIEEFLNGKAVNKMASAYGRENYDYNIDSDGNYYDGWMKENLKNNRIVYDIDEGIIKKKVNGRWLQLPNAVDSLSVIQDAPIINIIRPSQNYVNNSQENFAFPTNEQLQAMDNKKISESTDTLNLKEVNQNFNAESKSTNLDKSTSKSYKDIKLNETKNIPTNDILELLKDEGGYRKQEYVSELKESIKKDGIKTPIEISIGSDGQYQIDNGKHRLQIAKELGIDKVPVKLVESWSDIVSRKVNKGAEGNDGATNNNNVFNEESRSSGGMSRNGNGILEDGRTATRNVELFDGESDGIKQRSSVQASRNNIENSEKGSFLMHTNVNNISLNDEMFDFYQQVFNNSNYSTTFKQRIGEMLEKTKSRAQFEKIKETVANYKTNLTPTEIDKRANEVRKYIDEQNSIISTKGLKMKNSDIVDTIVDNVGMSKKHNYRTLNKVASEINDLLYKGELTDTKIEEIVNNLGENIQTSIDEYYEANKELKKTIQNTQVYVSDKVKKGFNDWNDFRKRAMGSIKITNNSKALPVDTFYMELSNTYGEDMFPSNISNASDQLQRIIEVAKQIKKTDTNFANYVEKTQGTNAWNEVSKQLVETVKEMRTELGKNSTYVAIPESKGGIRERNWTKTAKENDLVKNFLDVKDLKYQIQTNSLTVKKANAILDSVGYETAYNNITSKIKTGEMMTAKDIALGERLIQEYIKNGEYEKATDLIYDVTIIGTELGQAVQAMRLIKRLSPQGQLAYLQRAVERINTKQNIKESKQNKKKISDKLKKYETKIETGTQIKMGMEDSNQITIPKELSNNLLGAQTSEEIEEAVDRIKQSIADQMPVDFSEKTNEWRYLAMLGNPKTHIRNVVSNVAMRGTYEVKNVLQRTIEEVASPLLEERTRTFKKASEEVQKFAKQSAIDNKETINGGGKLNVEQEIKSMRQIFKNEPLEKLRKFNSKMLDAEDLFFSQSAYTNNLSEYLTANGIKTQKDIDLNPEIVEKGIQFAIKEAQKTTFRQYSKIASLLSQAENVNEITELAIGGVVPFKKTPINIAKTGASYSPLGLIETLTNETIKLKKGNITANEYIDRLSQGITGTALVALGYVLTSVGILNGSSDDDKDKYNELVGVKVPYTIKIGGTSFDLSWLSPTAMPLFMGAELYEGLKNKDGNLNWNDIANITTKTIDPLSEMSMVSSAVDALTSYSSNGTEKISNILKSSAESYVGQYFPTIFSQLNKTIDKTVRSTKASKNSSFKDLEAVARQNLNKVPFASMLLEPSTDVWGNEKERSNNVLVRALDAFVNAGTITTENITDVDKEIMSLYDLSNNTDIVPTIPNNYFSSNGYKYEMSAKEYTQFKKTYGQTAYKELEKLFDTKEYKSMTDMEKEKAITDVYDYAEEKARSDYGFNVDDIVEKYGEEEGASRLLAKDNLEKYEKAKSAGIPLVDYYNAWLAQKNAEGKKNAFGKTISGSLKKAKIEAIQEATDLTTEQNKVLYGIFNLGK
jgi:hypothetical protein